MNREVLTSLAVDLPNALRDTLRIARARGTATSCLLAMCPYKSTELRSCTMLRLRGDDYSAARLARHHLRDAAEAWRLSPQTIDDLVTVAGELMANALEHGRGGTVTLSSALTANALTLTVTDEGSPEDRPLPPLPPGPPPPDVERGRGLLIVEALTTRWGSRRTATGLMVWAELPASQ
ncbi:ATP-binding protein [Streptomyces kunmingensis]|uniref:ATP-binding protein n=1 Tax=Streptomyces kunmingensis TaxID=68225 RepID=A0ABU6CHC1_9ACTN|nr:ATP-binding protein [Streptomyces kunmingensis]MEB3963591.1 ATP-binding protein [Streptomyces kunmingensis]